MPLSKGLNLQPLEWGCSVANRIVCGWTAWETSRSDCPVCDQGVITLSQHIQNETDKMYDYKICVMMLGFGLQFVEGLKSPNGCTVVNPMWLGVCIIFPELKLFRADFLLQPPSLSILQQISCHKWNKFLMIAAITEAISPSTPALLLNPHSLSPLFCFCPPQCVSAVNYPLGLEPWFPKSSTWRRKHGITTLTP